MYLDLFNDLKLNKRLLKIAGFEVAAYWAEVQSILKQVVKKQTADEKGFFNLDREYVKSETTLSIKKQLKCEDTLISLGVIARDEANPNRLAISVSGMIEVITNEDTSRFKKKTTALKAEERLAKTAGIKATMKKAIQETDPELRRALENWIEGMIEASNCRFTKAVVQLFEKTINEYTADKLLKLRIIEIATINSYRDAGWAINKLPGGIKNTLTPSPLSSQKIGTNVSDLSDSITF